MKRSLKMIGLLAILSFNGCGILSSKPVPSVPASDATVQCQKDCVSVSKAFIKEHGNLFDEAIRLRASLKMCQEKKP